MLTRLRKWQATFLKDVGQCKAEAYGGHRCLLLILFSRFDIKALTFSRVSSRTNLDVRVVDALPAVRMSGASRFSGPRDGGTSPAGFAPLTGSHWSTSLNHVPVSSFFEPARGGWPQR